MLIYVILYILFFNGSFPSHHHAMPPNLAWGLALALLGSSAPTAQIHIQWSSKSQPLSPLHSRSTASLGAEVSSCQHRAQHHVNIHKSVPWRRNIAPNSQSGNCLQIMHDRHKRVQTWNSPTFNVSIIYSLAELHLCLFVLVCSFKWIRQCFNQVLGVTHLHSFNVWAPCTLQLERFSFREVQVPMPCRWGQNEVRCTETVQQCCYIFHHTSSYAYIRPKTKTLLDSMHSFAEATLLEYACWASWYHINSHPFRYISLIP